jgi:hypothetical protein
LSLAPSLSTLSELDPRQAFRRSSSAENGDTELLRVDEKGFVRIYGCSVFETCGPSRFHKDGRRVYLITNKGAAEDLIRLTLLDAQSGTEELVESDPQKRVDLAAPLFSEKTDELIATVYVDDKPLVHWRDKTPRCSTSAWATRRRQKDGLSSSGSRR